MKTTFLLVTALFTGYAASAQLTITSGAELHVKGNATLSLQNTDLVNHGLFSAGNSTVFFTGNAPSAIGGSQPLQFYFIEIFKTSLAAVRLNRNISITGAVIFNGGFLDLNGFDADLGSTSALLNEQSTSHIIGNNGGAIVYTTTLNAPILANPGNLGAFITSPQNLGTVIIRRGHQSQANGYGNGQSILRYYEITPANNTALNATLRFSYFDDELNGLSENALVFYKRDNSVSWSSLGSDTRNTSINYVEKTGIASFTRLTLSSPNNALPVKFSLVNVKCDGNKVLVSWKTAQEQQSSHFTIERSANGTQWASIGTVTAAGYSNTERSYSFAGYDPASNSYYRVVEHDLNGNKQYSGAVRSACNMPPVLFTLTPNPVQRVILLNIITSNSSPCSIKVYDSKGALIKIQNAGLLQGSNQLRMDVERLPGGIYMVEATWDYGRTKKIVKVVKQ
jgi:hypothetical protein